MSIPENLALLLADSRQALFDEIKADGCATNGTRFEIGRAIGLMGHAQDAAKQRDELLEALQGLVNASFNDDVAATVSGLVKARAAIASALGEGERS